MGCVVTSPLPPGDSPMLNRVGQNPKWATSGHGYIILAALGVPNASERGIVDILKSASLTSNWVKFELGPLIST